MKFNAALTKEQAKEMFAYLEDIFTEVKILDIEAVRRLEKDKNSISLKAFRERCQKKRLEYVESRVYQRIAALCGDRRGTLRCRDVECSGGRSRLRGKCKGSTGGKSSGV